MPNYSHKGLSLLELLISVAIAAMLIIAISGFINTALKAGDSTHLKNDSLQQARFAMQRISNAISKSTQLRIPLAENTTTAWSESVRGDNADGYADMGVLAVSLDLTLDRNKDGWADANNDRDYLDVNKSGTRDAGEPERIDEDFDLDSNSDGKPGIMYIDDDGDVVVDEGSGAMARHDDDEDGQADEDSINGKDDDGDGAIDEDPHVDMNGDGKAGIINVDDDFDNSVDEGNNDDDDEDGSVIEDWVDEQVFFLNGTTLMERLPDINAVDGTDYTEYVIAENVSQFRVERMEGANGKSVLVDVTLTLSPSGGVPVSLNTRVGVGSGL